MERNAGPTLRSDLALNRTLGDLTTAKAGAERKPRLCLAKYRSEFVRKLRQICRRLRTRLHRELCPSLHLDLNLQLNLSLNPLLYRAFSATLFKTLLQ